MAVMCVVSLIFVWNTGLLRNDWLAIVNSLYHDSQNLVEISKAGPDISIQLDVKMEWLTHGVPNTRLSFELHLFLCGYVSCKTSGKHDE